MKYSLVWGWYSNPSMLKWEVFTSRIECWKRVRELMALRAEPEYGSNLKDRRLAVLQVSQPRESGEGRKVCSFKQYYADSGFCKWEQWGATTYLTTGETFG